MEDRTTRRLLTIGELSELTGVPVRTIRFYSDTRIAGAALVVEAVKAHGDGVDPVSGDGRARVGAIAAA